MNKQSSSKEQTRNQITSFGLLIISILVVGYFFINKDFSIFAFLIIGVPTAIIFSVQGLWQTIKENKILLFLFAISTISEVIYLIDLTRQLFI